MDHIAFNTHYSTYNDISTSSTSTHKGYTSSSYSTDTDATLHDESSTTGNASDLDDIKGTENEENPLKTFLQIRGISIANYNMACNFNISTALEIMIRYEIFILAIQEHTPWNKELSEGEILSITKTCDRWQYSIIVSKMQLVIIDKQLATCLRSTDTYEDGRIIRLKFEIATKEFAHFVSVYGYPHSPNNRSSHYMPISDEDSLLQKMRTLQKQLTSITSKAIIADEIIFVFGDLQDTPDNSRLFHYGSNNIIKHPLGIVQACEKLGLVCTIYDHLDSLPKPIISRHGSKGGRFIDGMYTLKQALPYILGITIVMDTGIYSDHDLII